MFKINSSRPSKCSEIQSFQGTSPPGPPPGGSEHPLDPSSNKRSLRERIRSLRERDNISYEIKNSIFNKNGLWQKCLDATLISYICLRQYNNLAVKFHMTGEKICCVQIKIYSSKIMVTFVMSFPTWFKLLSVQNNLTQDLQMLWNPKFPGCFAPTPTRGSRSQF